MGDRVRLDHLRLEDVEDAPGLLTSEQRGHRSIHIAGFGDAEVAGGLGDLAGHPHLHLPGLHYSPAQRQPVDQVQRVGHQPPRRQLMALATDRQLSNTQILHHRGTATTDSAEPAHPGVLPFYRPGLRVLGMQISPPHRQQEVVDLTHPA